MKHFLVEVRFLVAVATHIIRQHTLSTIFSLVCSIRFDPHHRKCVLSISAHNEPFRPPLPPPFSPFELIHLPHSPFSLTFVLFVLIIPSKFWKCQDSFNLGRLSPTHLHLLDNVFIQILSKDFITFPTVCLIAFHLTGNNHGLQCGFLSWNPRRAGNRQLRDTQRSRFYYYCM